MQPAAAAQLQPMSPCTLGGSRMGWREHRAMMSAVCASRQAAAPPSPKQTGFCTPSLSPAACSLNVCYFHGAYESDAAVQLVLEQLTGGMLWDRCGAVGAGSRGRQAGRQMGSGSLLGCGVSEGQATGTGH